MQRPEVDKEKDQILNENFIANILKKLGPDIQLDSLTEDLIKKIALDFIDSVSKDACQLARKRASDTLETSDIHQILQKKYGMILPGAPSVKASDTQEPTVSNEYSRKQAAIKQFLSQT